MNVPSDHGSSSFHPRPFIIDAVCVSDVCRLRRLCHAYARFDYSCIPYEPSSLLSNQPLSFQVGRQTLDRFTYFGWHNRMHTLELSLDSLRPSTSQMGLMPLGAKDLACARSSKTFGCCFVSFQFEFPLFLSLLLPHTFILLNWRFIGLPCF